MDIDLDGYKLALEGAAQDAPRVLFLPPGAGPSVWAFSGDKYTVKAGVGETGGALGLMEAEIPPRSGPPLHAHNNEAEAFYVVRGRVEVEANGHTLLAEEGAFIHIPRGAPHRFQNVGDEPARMLLFFLPSGFEEFFLEIGTPVVEGRPAPGPDTFDEHVADAMTVAGEKYGIVSL